MGTNYYALMEDSNEKIHIGKNSSGWKFTINENRQYWRTPLDLFEFLNRNDVWIEDEYGESISSNRLVGEIIRSSISDTNKVAYGEHSYTLNGYAFHIGDFC